jgi:hypothetical protein
MPTLDADPAEDDDEKIEFADPEPIKGLTVADLRASSCRWPNGDPRDLTTFRYCGEIAHGGLYCERHARLAYMPSGTRLFASLHPPCRSSAAERAAMSPSIS